MSSGEVVFLRYIVAALSAPFTILIASLTVIPLMAAIKMGFASVEAFSAARFIDSLNSSTFLPIPIAFSFDSISFASGGKGILISGFPQYPLRTETCLTPSPVPFTSASLIPSTASFSVKPLFLELSNFLASFRNCASVCCIPRIAITTRIQIFFILSSI